MLVECYRQVVGSRSNQLCPHAVAGGEQQAVESAASFAATDRASLSVDTTKIENIYFLSLPLM